MAAKPMRMGSLSICQDRVKCKYYNLSINIWKLSLITLTFDAICEDPAWTSAIHPPDA